MLAMLFVVLVWFLLQILPAIPKPGETFLFFGEPSSAKQMPLYGRVTFRINGDNNADFVLWMNPENRERFNIWFGPEQPLRIDAVRTLSRDWLVVGMGSNVGELNQQELWEWRRMWLVSTGLFLVFGTLVWLWLFREYSTYFRHKSWFRNR